MNEIFQTAAEILLDFCGEEALLRTGTTAKRIRAVPAGAVKQSADSSGNAARRTRSFLLELNSEKRSSRRRAVWFSGTRNISFFPLLCFRREKSAKRKRRCWNETPFLSASGEYGRRLPQTGRTRFRVDCGDGEGALSACRRCDSGPERPRPRQLALFGRFAGLLFRRLHRVRFRSRPGGIFRRRARRYAVHHEQRSLHRAAGRRVVRAGARRNRRPRSFRLFLQL